MLPKALSLALLSVKVRPEDMSINDIIVRLVAIESIADVPLPLDEAVALVEELEMLDDELMRRTFAEYGCFIGPVSKARH